MAATEDENKDSLQARLGKLEGKTKIAYNIIQLLKRQPVLSSEV